MKNRHNEATLNRPNGDRDIDSSFVKIDLPFYMKTIKEEEAWHKNDRNAITVFKTDCMCIVLIGMHKDAELTYHVAECVTSVQLIEGNARVQISDKTQISARAVSLRSTGVLTTVYVQLKRCFSC